MVTIWKYCTDSSDDFVLMENSQIDIANTYNGHDDLSSAKTACLDDKHCIGIYDASCNKSGPFMLMKFSFMTSVYGKSCFYKKTRNGRYLLALMLSSNIRIYYQWLTEDDVVAFICTLYQTPNPNALMYLCISPRLVMSGLLLIVLPQINGWELVFTLINAAFLMAYIS